MTVQPKPCASPERGQPNTSRRIYSQGQVLLHRCSQPDASYSPLCEELHPQLVSNGQGGGLFGPCVEVVPYQLVTVLGTGPRHVLFPRRDVAGVSTMYKAGFYPGKKGQSTSLAHLHPAVYCPEDQASITEEGRKPSRRRK